MEEKNELKEKVVAINRVAKVVKGGRTFRFSAVVVVGDENGHVGVGNGKAAEVPDAIKSVRPVLELAGYKNIRTKVIGTNNPRNVVYATLEGLKAMQTVEQVAKKRGKKVEDII